VTEIPEWQGPLVLDASALREGEGARWMQRPETVITPHPGEFGRLFGLDRPLSYQTSERLRRAREVATGPGILALKGAQSVVAGGSSAALLVNTTGHRGLSTGGSGDFLAGMVAAKTGIWKKERRGGAGPDLERLRKAVAEAVWLHGAAADRLGPGPLLVRDLGESLAGMLRELNGTTHG
jgi:NAD(P)H-hydrate epimerase